MGFVEWRGFDRVAIAKERSIGTPIAKLKQ